MNKEISLSTKSSRGRGWRNYKRPDRQFYVPGALQRKKLEQNTLSEDKNVTEQLVNSVETSTNALRCAKIEENAEIKKNIPDESLRSEETLLAMNEELIPEDGSTRSKSDQPNYINVDPLSDTTKCEDHRKSAEDKGERLTDHSLHMKLESKDELKTGKQNHDKSNDVNKNVDMSKTNGNFSDQTLTCDQSNTQQCILSKSACSENSNRHHNNLDNSTLILKETKELDNGCTENTTTDDSKEGVIISSSSSLHNSKMIKEILGSSWDEMKKQDEKEVVGSKESCGVNDGLKENTKKYESRNTKEDVSVHINNNSKQESKLTNDNSINWEKKDEVNMLSHEAACSTITNTRHESTELQSYKPVTSNDISNKYIDDIECTKTQSHSETKKTQTEDVCAEMQGNKNKEENSCVLHCNVEKESTVSQSHESKKESAEHDLLETSVLSVEKKTEIRLTNEGTNETITSTNCLSSCETLEEPGNEKINVHTIYFNSNSNVSTESKAEINTSKNISENISSTEKSHPTLTEMKEDQLKLDKAKKKKKSKKCGHSESKEVKKKKKSKKELVENRKDEPCRSKDDKFKSKTKVKEMEMASCKNESLEKDENHVLEDECDEDDDSWLTKFDDDGECKDPELIRELSKATGIKNPIKHKTQFDFYALAEKDVELDDGYGHIVEIYDFSADLKTQDLTKSLSIFKDQGYELKWVDDTHALAAFASPLAANQAIQLCSSPLLKLRPVSQGIAESKKKAERCFEFLQPYKPRPQTTKLTAHMLVTGALGVKSRMSKEEKQKEKDKLKEAREQKRQEKQRKADIWGD